MRQNWRELLPRFTRQAGRKVRHPKRVAELVTKVYRKAADNRGPLEAVWADLQTMLRLVRAWVSGDYRQVSRTTVVSIVGALAYFLSPIDAILDIVPLLGLLDDAAVIGLVVGEVRAELQAFRTWEAEAERRRLPAQETASHA